MSGVQKISSRRSVQTYLVAVGLIIMGLALGALCVAAWFQGVEPRWSVILFGVLGVYMVFLGVDEGWLSGLEVTPEALRIQSFGRWEEHPLTRFEAVDGLRDILGGGLQLVLIAAQGQALRVPLRRYANAGQLTQALLDALWLKNNDLLTMPRLARRLGQPPFGVFAGKKSRR
ncbi:MAG: amino acid ABC transporter permease [Meiothermus sp.]|nr:amino acid ABC transporter permease [Meiothermus sp.]MCS7067734.1 amino acid ABC transporter permease [Meiothermus sp.]MCX7600600.1 amino acid ABC transporter permease [Meiothermus sp.]